MKRRNVLLLTGIVMGVLALGGCGNTADGGNTTQQSSQESQVTVESSEETPASSEEVVEPSQEEQTPANPSDNQSDSETVNALTAVWNGIPEEGKFPCYGGQVSSPVEGAPGALDVTDKDSLSYTLLIPEDIQGDVAEAADLVHFMNANTFTSAALKVTSDQAAFINALQDGIMNTQFMCGMPDRLVVFSYGDIVIYAFGADDIVADFETAAQNNLEGVKAEVNQLFN